MRTDRWGKERSVIGGALVMAVAAVGLLTLQDWALPGMVAVAIFIGCFEFSIVSAIPIAGDLVPGNPARGIALLMASSAIGRGITTIPTTWLYDRHGIGASAALAAGWTFVAAAMMAARLRAARSRPAI
jgi:predicted MFS family arabinose efflux permease